MTALTLFNYGLRALGLRPLRTLAQVAAIAATLGLLGSVVLFVESSLATMTYAAAARVPLDWQAAVADQASAERLSTSLAGHSGIREARPAAVAGFTGAQHAAGNTVTRAGSGGILVVGPDYLGALQPFHMLRGSQADTGLVLSQPLASTLQAQVGDPIRLQAGRGLSAPMTVTGIAVVDATDLLFQPVGPAATGAPAAPPTQVAIIPPGLFNAAVAPVLAGANAPLQWQVHAQVDRSLLTGDPGGAATQLDTFRHVIERTYPGQLTFADNLAAQLGVAAEQALYAEALFIFLALPGVLIVLALAYYAAAAGSEEERRHVALLRTRGADLRDLLSAAVSEGLLIGLVAWILGTVTALVASRQVMGPGQAPNGGQVTAAAAILLVVSLLASVGARIASVALARRQVVTAARAVAPRARRPFWQRFYLDILALLLAGAVFAIDRATGLSAVVTPDSNPTVALSLYSFLAPTLVWVGVTLLLVRIGSGLLRRTAAGFASGTGSLRSFLLHSASRRANAINRGVILVGLLLSFAVSLSLFAATYQQQALVDAQLTLGADVVLTPPTGSPLSSSTVDSARHAAGVRALSPLRHTFAYVGPDLQDMFAIDPSTISGATTLRDSYVSGAGFNDLLARMRTRRDGVLVSQETIKDYGLAIGDLLQLRLLDEPSGNYHVVPFHVLGVVTEFPAAPKDSFLVANLDYVVAQTHAAGPNTAFIASSGDPRQTAAAVAAAVAPSGGSVREISGQVAQTSSSLTAINLTGISRLEQGFAVVLAAASLILFAILTTVERRREFALMAAMGTRLRVIASFVWTEALMVSLAATLVSAVLGTVLAVMLVAILTHVFDPPPDFLTLPWPYLLALFVTTALGTIAGGLAGATTLRRLQLSTVLREG